MVRIFRRHARLGVAIRLKTKEFSELIVRELTNEVTCKKKIILR
jgi:hypothetical protein